MSPSNEPPIVGVGRTAELNLRVSIASLARVVFPNPEDGELMLALEHKATLLPGEERVVVKAQPFGGAVRILDLQALQTLIGNFHFDSQKSRSEQDFRLFIRSSDWKAVRDFCLREFGRVEDSALESDPARELEEEFQDALGIELRPDQYRLKTAGIVLENEPAHTKNVRAAGWPTVRVYRTFEAQILDSTLCRAMLANDAENSSEVLQSLALDDARQGGLGRANAMLVASMQGVRDAYLALSPDQRSRPLPFKNTILDGNVLAVLEGISASKYRIVQSAH